MKVSLSWFFLFLFVSVKAQERTPYLTDSLIKVLHVKSSVRFIGNGGASETIFYKENGDINQIISSVENNTPMIKTVFIYDNSGKLHSTIRQVCKEYLTKCVLLNSQHKCVQNITTYYDYDSQSRLKRIYNQDSSGRILSESMYKYDTLQIITKSYNLDHSISESIEDFEKTNVISRFTGINYDSIGNVFPASSSIYKNKFNNKKQLVKSRFKIQEITCTKFYEYYPNGLIKRKFGDDCLFNWTISYTFY
jgi:hypothetical protein